MARIPKKRSRAAKKGAQDSKLTVKDGNLVVESTSSSTANPKNSSDKENNSSQNVPQKEQIPATEQTSSISPNYWKDLAEQRRIVLAKALADNKSLHEQVEVLQTDNKNLAEIADRGNQLCEILRAFVEKS